MITFMNRGLKPNGLCPKPRVISRRFFLAANGKCTSTHRVKTQKIFNGDLNAAKQNLMEQ